MDNASEITHTHSTAYNTHTHTHTPAGPLSGVGLQSLDVLFEGVLLTPSHCAQSGN